MSSCILQEDILTMTNVFSDVSSNTVNNSLEFTWTLSTIEAFQIEFPYWKEMLAITYKVIASIS